MDLHWNFLPEAAATPQEGGKSPGTHTLCPEGTSTWSSLLTVGLQPRRRAWHTRDAQYTYVEFQSFVLTVKARTFECTFYNRCDHICV